MSETNSSRVIKRYSNRKLYDTVESSYITLEQIAELIRQGEDIKVVDNNNKEDITAVTLAQIIFEEEKKQPSFLSLQTMRHLIQGGSQQIMGIVQQKISASAGKMGRVFRHEKNEMSEADLGEEEAQLAIASEGEEPLEHERPDRQEAARTIKDFLDNVQHSVDDWQKRIEASIHHAMENISPLAPLQKELHALAERLVELEAKITKLEQDDQD